MFNKRLITRAAVIALPILIIAGCATPQAGDENNAASGEAAAAKRIAEDALVAVRDLRMELAEAKKAAERAALAAEAAAEKADRIFQRGMRK